MKTFASLAFAISLLIPVAFAEPPGPEPSLAYSFKDASLQWGPCPAFIPKGCEIAVLHGDATKPNADVFFKVPGDFTIPDHWHSSAERMVLVSGKLTVMYQGQAPATLTPGMYAYGPARLSHKAYCEKGDPCVLFIAFEGPVDATPAATLAN